MIKARETYTVSGATKTFQGNRWDETDWIVIQNSLASFFVEKRKTKFIPSFKREIYMWFWKNSGNLAAYEEKSMEKSSAGAISRNVGYIVASIVIAHPGRDLYQEMTSVTHKILTIWKKNNSFQLSIFNT